MKRLIISCLAIVGMSALLQADAWNKKTELTVNETIQVPGATLTPGKYVVKLVDSQANRHIVQFTNERGDKVISTVLAIPNERLEPTGESEFSFYEGTTAGAPALRAWFYPGDNQGQQFAYPEQKAQELARASGQEVPAYTGDDISSAQVTTVSPSNQEKTAVADSSARPETTPARAQSSRPSDEQAESTDPALMAQAQPRPQPRTSREPAATPAQQQQPERTPAGQAEPSQRDLPATASPAPLLGLMGLLSIGAAVGLRRLSKQQS